MFGLNVGECAAEFRFFFLQLFFCGSVGPSLLLHFAFDPLVRLSEKTTLLGGLLAAWSALSKIIL